MTKQEFIESLKYKLSCLPKKDLDERISFYSEILDDYIDEGLSENAAVDKIGGIDKIVNEILNTTPLIKLAKEKLKPKKKISSWILILIILGSPIWFSLLVAALSVIFSGCVTIWAVIITLWSVLVAFFASSIGAFIVGIYYLFTPNTFSATMFLSCSLILSGLSIFSYIGCKKLTLLLGKLTKSLILQIKKCFVRKEIK